MAGFEWSRETLIEALGERVVFAIGQISARDRAWLDREAKAGRVRKIRALWPYFDSGFSRKMAYWRDDVCPQASRLVAQLEAWHVR